jgi:hypothetical protein
MTVFSSYARSSRTVIRPDARSIVTSVSVSSASRLRAPAGRVPRPASGQVTRPGKKWMPRPR